MTSRLTARQVAVLKNAPGRNATVQQAFMKTLDALNAALEAVGGKLRQGATADLQRILKIALNLSRAKGMYEGLRDGFRLHELSVEIEEDAAARSLMRRISKYRDGDQQVTAEALCKYLDGEIQRLDGKDSQPFPPARWGIGERQIDPWQFALRGPDKKLRATLSTYLSRKRDEAWGEDYSFILAWEELSRSTRKKTEEKELPGEDGISSPEIVPENDEQGS